MNPTESSSGTTPSDSETREGMLSKGRLQIGFISGPLEAPAEYFTTHYVPSLERGMALGHNFILGVARGIDSMALQYLLSSRPPRYPANKVTIYLSQTESSRLRPKYNWFEKNGGTVVIAGRNHTERDEAMTRASHYDILRYRTEEECRALYGDKFRARVSGTEKNELRRKTGIGLIWREIEGAVEGAVEAAPTTMVPPASAEDKRRRNLERKVKEAARLKQCLARGEALEANQVAKAEKHDVWLKELQDLGDVKL